jgi:hypothetical protein
MRITSRQLRQIIREELIREAYDNTPLVSYVTLRGVAEAFVFDELQGQYAAEAGRAPKGDVLKGLKRSAESEVRGMFQTDGDGRTSLMLGSQEQFNRFLDKLLNFSSRRGEVVKLKVSAVHQEELQDPKRILVHNCPGWPAELTGRDLYKIGTLLSQNPRFGSLVEQYREAFDLGDESGVLSRGVIFMIIDLILSSAPKGNSLYYIPEPELCFTVFKPTFAVPKGVTMTSLERGA